MLFGGAGAIILFILNKILRITNYVSITNSLKYQKSAKMTFDELRQYYEINKGAFTLEEAYAIQGSGYTAESRNRIYMSSYKDYLKYFWWRQRERTQAYVESQAREKKNNESQSNAERERLIKDFNDKYNDTSTKTM